MRLAAFAALLLLAGAVPVTRNDGSLTAADLSLLEAGAADLSLLEARDLSAIPIDIGPAATVPDDTQTSLHAFVEGAGRLLLEAPCLPMPKRMSHAQFIVNASLDGASIHTLDPWAEASAGGSQSYTLKYATSAGPIIADVLRKFDGAFKLLAIE